VNEINSRYKKEYEKLEMLRGTLKDKVDDIVRLFIEKL